MAFPSVTLAHPLLPLFVPLYRHTELADCWLGQLAFAHDLIAASRPKLIVQLGANPDEFYFACCQSVSQNGLDCLCYALYSGAENQPAYYYNSSQYSAFSFLLRTEGGGTEALSQFSDASIDLLHLTGLQTYAAVRHAFRSWLPKLRPGAVLLLSDISTREADFGVWRLWDEITAEFEQTFAFHEGRGLGVLRLPDGSEDSSAFLCSVCAGSPAEQEFIRRYYSFYTSSLQNKLRPQGEPISQEVHHALLRELQTAQAERMMTVTELKQVVEQRNAARRELYQMEHDLKTVQAHGVQLAIDVANWKSMVDYERNIREQILASLSWKLTAPLRIGIAWVRKLRGVGKAQ